MSAPFDPTIWNSYLPQSDDYDDAQAFIDALKAGSLDTSARLGTSDATERSVAINKFGGANPGSRPRDKSFYAGLGGKALVMDSAARVDPEGAALAYHAYDEYGNPYLPDDVLGMLQQNLGIGAYEPPVDPAAPSGPPLNMGFIDTGKGYYQNAAGMSAYMDPTTGEWTYYVLGQDRQTWVPMTPEQFQSFWDNSPYGGGTGQGAPIISQGDNGSGFQDAAQNQPPAAGIGEYTPGIGNVDPVQGNGAYPGGGMPQPGMLGSAATIDPRYPDWLLEANQRRRAKMTGQIPFDGLGGY